MLSRTCHVVPALVLLASGFLGIGCNSGSSDNSKNAANAAATVAALPALPQEDAALLRPVLDQQGVLATREIHLDVQPPPEGPAQRSCTADDVETEYSVAVLHPVTFCTTQSPADGNLTTQGEVNGNLQKVHGPATHKLEISALSPAQLAAFGGTAPTAALSCHQSKGPWQGMLTSGQACSGTCIPQNTLTLTNTPNTITFHWEGTIDAHPSVFQFQGVPTPEGTVDWSRCENVKSKTAQKGK